MRSALAIGCAVLGLFVSGGPRCMGETPSDWMLELSLHGQRIEGAPVTWNEREVVLMGRDGQLWQFGPGEARDYRKTSDRFYGYSAGELRSILQRELGGRFDVSGTRHYLVAHPRGERDEWADRFEDLYRRFVHYFTVRGFTLAEPPFPLVGIVCRNREEFSRYAAARGAPSGGGVLGFFSNQTNRIVLYDVGGGDTGAAGWQQNAATVVHEATHQMAFNTGIHSRYAQPPLWVAEGLATMFEGVVAAGRGSDGPPKARANPSRLAVFRAGVAAEHRPEMLAELVAADRLFRAAPAAAYAEAWALTFYLVETQPARYAEYLARTARRPAFERYSSKQRTADFTSVFGDDWRMLEARLLRFIDELR
jgi:hypothetical protein